MCVIFIFLSCKDPEGEENYSGFSFIISNTTNQSYDGEIMVGGLINQKFKSTDSIKLEKTLEIGSAALPSHFVDENRWKPNLTRIKNLPSESCYFKLKLSNGREEIIGVNNINDFFMSKS